MRQMTKAARQALDEDMLVSKRELALKIYQLFETASNERAREHFDLYDENPKNLPKEFRWLIKQSCTAAELALRMCAKDCDDNGEPEAAAKLRKLLEASFSRS